MNVMKAATLELLRMACVVLLHKVCCELIWVTSLNMVIPQARKNINESSYISTTIKHLQIHVFTVRTLQYLVIG